MIVYLLDIAIVCLAHGTASMRENRGINTLSDALLLLVTEAGAPNSGKNIYVHTIHLSHAYCSNVLLELFTIVEIQSNLLITIIFKTISPF